MKKTVFLIAVIVLAAFAGAYYARERSKTIPQQSNASVADNVATKNSTAGLVLVDTVEVHTLESFPVQIQLAVAGNLADGCTKLAEAKIDKSGNHFTVTLPTTRAADVFCTQALVPFTKNISLPVVGLSKGDYTVSVNGVDASFTLASDNVLQGGLVENNQATDEPAKATEPAPATSKTTQPAEGTTTPSGPSAPITNLAFESYTNRSVGYTIDRPSLWYWEHDNKNDIDGTHPNVDDYLIMDTAPLAGLNADPLGLVAIEVSDLPLSAFATDVAGLQKEDATVGGVSAARYSGSVNGEQRVEYQFTRNQKTFRLIYRDATNAGRGADAFAHIVTSFSFN
ncbi:hypothetical protein COV04_02985 [Candidatus Uhrbacteria bacterium CG10_big_fil_rev_8_21_14_0_10_48_11]|uniref:Uncharacterized protein n=1 Tax=Candidatus Uhrbacteria bacterium CG10_big_fil_rev_8_21_14_0_10_48_11 TaxID=1975037 RepID=A0A2M8LEM3_9BACT|nr:MAG: hypothetical protein COV04_02985 [Candidatus Uhrbacteria bacterium CG10_big_fil_rev_8_21_14_0_10_48_11]